MLLLIPSVLALFSVTTIVQAVLFSNDNMMLDEILRNTVSW